MRCFGSDRFIRLVGVDIHGNFRDTYDEIEPDDKPQDFGHPAVSPDGTPPCTRSPTARSPGKGTLFAINLDTHRRSVLLAPEGKYAAFGDPVFSPAGDMLVRRATTRPNPDRPRRGLSRSSPLRIVDEELDLDNLILVSGDVAGDDDGPDVLPRRHADRLHPLAPGRPGTPTSWSPTSPGSSGSPPSPTRTTAASSAATPTPSTPSPPGPAADLATPGQR